MTSISAREQSDITKAKVPVSLLWQLATVIISALLAYAAITDRLVAVETKQGESEKRMERIENKLDRVLERITK